MDCIIAPKFTSQPKEVQENLKTYALDNLGDFTEFAKPIGETKSYEIFYLAWIERNEATFISLMNCKQVNKSVFNLQDFIPMYNETQLRKFIEEEASKQIEKALGGRPNIKISTQLLTTGYSIQLLQTYMYNGIRKGHLYNHYETNADDLLEAYWQVTTKIIEEGMIK